MSMVAFNTYINQESIAYKSSTMTDHLQVQQHQQLELPPGFRFHPTDKEIIISYLIPKVLEESFIAVAIEEVDLNKYEPWELPGKAKMGEKEWYFYSQKDRKFPTGIRTNRATPSGYWKSTGKDKEIFHPHPMIIGMKKTLVFYKGRAPKGEKTNWFMHEYRIGSGKQTTLDLPTLGTINVNSKEEWVVCRIFHKSIELKKVAKSPYTIPMSMGEDHQQAFIDLSILSPHMDYKVSQSLAPPSSLPLASSYQVDTIGACSPMMGCTTLPMINDHYFGNHHQQMMAPWPPLISLYQQKHEMMMQMQMGGVKGFMVEAGPGSGPSSTVPQENDITRMSTNDPCNGTAAAVSGISLVNMGMDYMWKY